MGNNMPGKASSACVVEGGGIQPANGVGGHATPKNSNAGRLQQARHSPQTPAGSDHLTATTPPGTGGGI